MFIELFITNTAILSYHRGNLLILRFEIFMKKYFMQILNAEKAPFLQNFQEKTVLIRNMGLFHSFKKPS